MGHDLAPPIVNERQFAPHENALLEFAANPV
jgi:hypothetical protein